MKVFHSSLNLYNYSKNKILFKEKLIQSNLFISNDLYYSLVNSKVKEQSHNIFKELKLKKVKIIPIFSKYYVDNLKRMYNPPFALFVKGNLEILKNINIKKKVFIYSNSKFSIYGRKVYNSINNYILYKDCINIYKRENSIKDKLLDNKLNNNLFKEIIIMCNKKCSISFLDIQSNNISKNNKYCEIISGISDILVIPESNFNFEINVIVETFLELGKDILVAPGNILSNNSYFSNLLIQEGAYVFLKNSDLDKFLKPY